MIDKSGSSVASTAFGNKIDPPLPYDYKWSIYADGAELVAAKDELTIDEQVKVRNTERQNNARQKALATALDNAAKAWTEANPNGGINPYVKRTAENDPQVGLRDMFKTLQTAKLPDGSRRYTDEQAKAAASQMLGVEWAE
jgi:hypothetical protein